MSSKCNVPSKKKQTVKYTKNLHIVHPYCAGLDIHKETIWVCTSPFQDGIAPEVTTFGTDTVSLENLAAYLHERKITSVAMESTGVYWLQTFLHLRNANLNPILVNPSDVKNIKGRPKSDRADSVWICRLHSYGFLQASFVPENQILNLRNFYYACEKLTKESGSHIQRMNDELVKMNIRIDLILTDLTGVSGSRLVNAILQGERSPENLYKLLDRQIIQKKPKSEILRYLSGNFDENNLLVLKVWHDLYIFIQTSLNNIKEQMCMIMDSFPKKADRKDIPPPKKNYREDYLKFPIEMRPLFYEIYGVDLTQFPGIGAGTVTALLCTVGTDLSPWPSEKHFVSWLGLAPINKESAGYRKSGATRKIKNPLANAFKMAAMTAKRTTSYIGNTARRLASRILPKKAKVATARKLAALVYKVLQKGMPLTVHTEEEYQQKKEEHKIKTFLRDLGKYIVDGKFTPEVLEVCNKSSYKVEIESFLGV
jgi:transposase